MKFTLLLAALVGATFSNLQAEAPALIAQPNPAPPPTIQNVTRATTPVAVPVASEQAMRFYRSGNVLWCVRAVQGPLIPALFLFTGFSARLRSWAERVSPQWYFAFALYWVAFAGLCYLIELPLDYYRGFVRLHSYDLSNQTFGKWFGDSLKNLGVLVAIGLAGGWIPFQLIKRSPRRWWLYLGLLYVPCSCMMLLIWPVIIDPLFNRFQPLQDQALEAKILTLAARAGIEGGRVYEVDKSVDTKTVNAYVTGFLGSKRIVFWDTALRTLDESELFAVLGHEMGHYVLGHIVQSIALSSVLVFVALYASHRWLARIPGRYQERFGIRAWSDFAALPLLILLTNLFALVFAPAELAFSRHQEHEADRFGLELLRNNHASATALLKLQQHNLSNPRPGRIYTLLRASHPGIGERIDFCNRYRPWEAGGPAGYDEYIRQRPAP